MTVTINGTTGVAGVDGTASTPAIQGNDTNTGIFFPAADTIAFAEGGAEVARFDSNGNLGVGTTSPTNFANYKTIAINGTSGGVLDLQNNGTSTGLIFCDNQLVTIRGGTSTPLVFQTNGANERMRIESGGNVIFYGGNANLVLNSTATSRYWQQNASNSEGAGFTYHVFQRGGSGVGSITFNGSGVSYNTTSDYRLKDNVAPMTDALSKVALLKPCTYTWKADGSDGQGFIAHELAEVAPDCVTGEKDAVDEEGKPQYQGIDTSFLVATLTAAIQEQQAIITDLKARIETLENK
jgi:hypothetical protein